jgi:hypothetical protein
MRVHGRGRGADEPVKDGLDGAEALGGRHGRRIVFFLRVDQTNKVLRLRVPRCVGVSARRHGRAQSVERATYLNELLNEVDGVRGNVRREALDDHLQRPDEVIVLDFVHQREVHCVLGVVVLALVCTHQTSDSHTIEMVVAAVNALSRR